MMVYGVYKHTPSTPVAHLENKVTLIFFQIHTKEKLNLHTRENISTRCCFTTTNAKKLK